MMKSEEVAIMAFNEEMIAKAKAFARESMAAIPKAFWGNELERMTVEQLQAILDLAPDWAQRWNSSGVWKGCYAAIGKGVLDADGVWHNKMDILPPGYELSEIRAELERRANEPIKVGDYVVHKANKSGVLQVVDDLSCTKADLIKKHRLDDAFIHINHSGLQDDYRRATAEERCERTIYLTDLRTGQQVTLGMDNFPAASPVIGIDLGQEGGDYTYCHPIIGAELFTQVVNLTCSHELAVKVINNTLSLDENFFEKNISQFDSNTVLIIKACPFCGGPPCVEVEQDKLWANQFPDDAPTYDAHVWCHECGARGSNTQLDFDNHDYYDKESTARSAIYKWNKRENTFGEETARLFNLERDL